MQAPLIASGVVTIVASLSAMLTLPPPPPPHKLTVPLRADDGNDARGRPGPASGAGGRAPAAEASLAEERPGGRSGRAANSGAEPAGAEGSASEGAAAAPAAAGVIDELDGVAGAGAVGADTGAGAVFASLDGAVNQPQKLPDRAVLVRTAIRDPAVLLLLASAFIGQISGSGFAVCIRGTAAFICGACSTAPCVRARACPTRYCGMHAGAIAAQRRRHIARDCPLSGL